MGIEGVPQGQDSGTGGKVDVSGVRDGVGIQVSGDRGRSRSGTDLSWDKAEGDLWGQGYRRDTDWDMGEGIGLR